MIMSDVLAQVRITTLRERLIMNPFKSRCNVNFDWTLIATRFVTIKPHVNFDWTSRQYLWQSNPIYTVANINITRQLSL